MHYSVQNDALKGNKTPKPTTPLIGPPPPNKCPKHVKRQSSTQPFLWLSLTPCPGLRISEESPNWLQSKTEMIQTADLCIYLQIFKLFRGEGSLTLSEGRNL